MHSNKQADGELARSASIASDPDWELLPPTHRKEYDVRPAAARQLTMKAIVRDTYGSPDVLELRDIDRPVVGDHDVLVRVHAAGVNPGVWHLMAGLPYLIRLGSGLLRPRNRVAGEDVAGRVEAVGKDVSQFQSGDEVFGTCNGSFAEYACARENKFVGKPANLTFEQAAAVPDSAVTALEGLRDTGQGEARAEGVDHRCGRRRGDVRGADCQGVGSGSHRRVQHDEDGPGPIDRR